MKKHFYTWDDVHTAATSIGGTVVEFKYSTTNSFDNKTKVYIIDDKEEFGKAIAEIIVQERLTRGDQ